MQTQTLVYKLVYKILDYGWMHVNISIVLYNLIEVASRFIIVEKGMRRGNMNSSNDGTAFDTRWQMRHL